MDNSTVLKEENAGNSRNLLKYLNLWQKKSAEAEENVKAQTKTFKDLKTKIKKTVRKKDLVATLLGPETKNVVILLDDYFWFHISLLTRSGLIFLGDKEVIPTGMRVCVLNALFSVMGLNQSWYEQQKLLLAGNRWEYLGQNERLYYLFDSGWEFKHSFA